ncbi:response regulator transcription factor, partial [Leptolyngbya sp. KIOST-1]|uniref:response regulator transcription factor n=1 Tax=Leptolyngbya sp. KIOST-1 TaxID=1229172 RepID=UPI001CEC89CF
TDESDKIRGFNEGADDYLTKPFSLGELEVRVGAILKRQRPVTAAEQQCLTFNSLAIDPVRREVMLNEEMVPLTALEFDLLHFLASHPGRVWRRAELITAKWMIGTWPTSLHQTCTRRWAARPQPSPL